MTDRGNLPGRRNCLRYGATLPLLALAPAFAAPQRRALFAAWQEGEHHVAGLLLGEGNEPLRAVVRIELPTRAHGLVAEPDGSVLVVARRPGDWLLRWHPRSGRCDWRWTDGREVLNGHALCTPSGAALFTTATDVASGDGVVQWRDARSLRVLARWPSGGRDPHALLWHGGRLWVANGGITTQPETGRVKRDLARMDSSLAAIRPADGRLLGRWRVDDPRLSLRHLAANGPLIGVAMQAEHDDATERERAPLLAVFDGERLRVAAGAADGESAITGGYGGDIAAVGRGFAVSATRAHRVLRWQADGGWQPSTELVEAGALAAYGNELAVAGRDGGCLVTGVNDAACHALVGAVRSDNHWVAARRVQA